MALHIKNLLNQLPFYGKTIKPRIKEFTNAKLLSQLPFFEKPIKAKTKQLSTNELLSIEPFYKHSIKKPRVKKLCDHKLLRELPFYGDINISRKKVHLKGILKPMKQKLLMIKI